MTTSTASPLPLEPVRPGDHARGAEAAAITVVEYGDYDCPHTRRAQAIVDRLVADHPDVRVVFRHFPLRHLHANAEMLARIAEAAHEQGKFWPMHDHLMNHHAPVDQEGLVRDADEVGVDLARVQRDVNDEKVEQRVERDVREGRASGVHSTPTFFFNGVLHDGHYDDDTLRAKLAEARRRLASSQP